MSRERWSLLPLAACTLLTTTLAAQGGRADTARQRHRDATRLHRAWLKENLDLDTRGAIAQYEQLRSRAPKARPERWIAIARLAELGRLGAIHPEPGTRPMQAPLEVQAALETLGQTVPWQNVLADPVAAVELPPLRPATERIMRWGRDQVGPTVDQRWLMQMRTREKSESGDNRWRNRNAAFTLLDVELEGTSARAESLRRLLFAGWRPPELDVDREQAVARARGRLGEMIESERSKRYKTRLEALQERFNKLAATDENAALELVMRLPFLAEELLLAPPADAPADAAPGEKGEKR